MYMHDIHMQGYYSQMNNIPISYGPIGINFENVFFLSCLHAKA